MKKKHLTKFIHPFMIKKEAFSKLGRKFLNIKRHLQKNYSYTQWWKNMCFPIIRSKARMFPLISFYSVLEVLANEIRQEK